jgi:hypothetical protein
MKQTGSSETSISYHLAPRDNPDEGKEFISTVVEACDLGKPISLNVTVTLDIVHTLGFLQPRFSELLCFRQQV